MKLTKPAIKWLRVNWCMFDADIARELGVSRERVRQVRVQLGLPSSKTLKWKLERWMIDTTLTRKQNAERLNVCLATLSQFLQKQEITVAKTPIIRRSKYGWEEMNWYQSNSEIIRQMGGKYSKARQLQVYHARRRYAPHTVGLFRKPRVRSKPSKRRSK